jgi:hypothetical protein
LRSTSLASSTARANCWASSSPAEAANSVRVVAIKAGWPAALPGVRWP